MSSLDDLPDDEYSETSRTYAQLIVDQLDEDGLETCVSMYIKYARMDQLEAIAKLVILEYARGSKEEDLLAEIAGMRSELVLNKATDAIDRSSRNYCIVRHYSDDRGEEVTRKNLTLWEAQDHCRDPKTCSKGEWFDGYRRQ